MNQAMRQINGACHCGNIRFVFTTAKEDSELPKRACQCSFCRMHGRISTSDPDGCMRVSIDNPDNVNRYRFGHGTAEFFVCRICGAVPVVTNDIDGVTVGLVDVRMLEGFTWSPSEVEPHHRDDEETDARLARRRRTWTGSVTFD